MAFLCLIVGLISYALEIKGKVVGVSDGDTITALVNKTPIKVRLYGIDCPEKRQAFGTKAKQFTSSLVFGKSVTLVVHGKDCYGRTIGKVILPYGKNLNHEILRAGFGWWYSRCAPNDSVLKKLEAEARRSRVGLWVDPNPIEPWNFRRVHKSKLQFTDEKFHRSQTGGLVPTFHVWTQARLVEDVRLRTRFNGKK
jgi:endonuclease YncB( thermonuclease family)